MTKLYYFEGNYTFLEFSAGRHATTDLRHVFWIEIIIVVGTDNLFRKAVHN